MALKNTWLGQKKATAARRIAQLRGGDWHSPAALTPPAGAPPPNSPSGGAALQLTLEGGELLMAMDIEPTEAEAARMTSSDARALAEAERALRTAPGEPLDGNGWLYCLTPHDAREMRASARALRLPVGALAPRAAWAELVTHTKRTGADWPGGPKRFTRAARIVARGRALDPDLYQAFGAEPADASGVSVLASQVDTIRFGAYTQIVGQVWDRLYALREVARILRDRPLWIGAGAHRLRVQGWAAGDGPYLMTLVGEACMLKIGRWRPNGDSPQVVLEVRSGWLWRMGVDRAVESLLSILRGWSLGGEFEVKVSRVDLAVDLQGFALSGSELPHRRLVTYAVRRAGYWTAKKAPKAKRPAQLDLAGRPSDGKARPKSLDAERRRRAAEARERHWLEKENSAAAYWHGQTFTGYMVGPGGRLTVRMYRKDLEMKRPGGAVWLPSIWASSGHYDSNRGVLRVEAQITGELLKRLVGVGGEARLKKHHKAKTSLQHWSALRGVLGGLWRYVVGEPDRDGGGWLSLREKGTHSKPHRWPIDPRWRALQRTAFGLGGVADDVARRAKVSRLTDRHVTTAQREALEAGAWKESAWAEAIAAGAVATDGLVPDDADTLAEVLASPELLGTWGTGPDRASLERLASAGFEIPRAEQRAEQATAQARGVLAWWVAESMAASGDREGDPGEWAVAHVLGLIDSDEWRASVANARARSGLRGALALGRQIVDGQTIGRRPESGRASIDGPGRAYTLKTRGAA